VRFRTIAIPATSTISAATLTLSFNPLTGSPSFKIYADDVDDAALWANGNVPSNITKTTAKATWSPTATGTSTLNILGLASEVLVRTGWASGNDIRFALLDNAPGTSTHKLTLRGYNHISLPQLDVTFTPPPSGPGGGLTLRGAG